MISQTIGRGGKFVLGADTNGRDIAVRAAVDGYFGTDRLQSGFVQNNRTRYTVVFGQGLQKEGVHE